MNKSLTPLKAIRQYCLTCAGRPKNVRECSTTECNLFRFRMGHNPARKGIGPDVGTARPIPEDILPNSTRFSERIKTKKRLGMPKDRSCDQEANNNEIRPSIEAVGKIQILDKKIIIELTKVE